MTTSLDLNVSMPELTRTLLDIYSVSGEEKTIADAVYESLSAYPHLHLTRDGDAMIARTEFGPRNGEERTRILLAGHLDTVPLPTVAGSLGTVPASIVEDNGDWVLYGRGATDMKGGVAVQLKLAAELGEHDTDYNLTYVFYDHEEVASELSGMARLIRNHGELLTDADFGVLLEPTDGTIEGGCNGTMRFYLRTAGLAAHSGRAWKGENAIHKLAGALRVLEEYEPQTYEVEGLAYREGLNAVQVSGGVAGNVIPDAAALHINYRFAPNKTLDEAKAHVTEIFDGYELDFVDLSPAARPGLDTPAGGITYRGCRAGTQTQIRVDRRGAAQRDRYSCGEFWSRRCAPCSHRQRARELQRAYPLLHRSAFLAAYRSRRRLADKPHTDTNTHFNSLCQPGR